MSIENQFRRQFGFDNRLIQYFKINPMNLIIESSDGKGAIFLGNIYAAYSVDLLKRNNITAVLTIAAGTQLKYKEEHGIKHKIINADDIETYQLHRHFDIIIDFISSMRNENRNILVHCFAGISRSATGLIAYMIKELGFTFQKALDTCKRLRKEVFPNRGFIKQVQQFEQKLKRSAVKQKIGGEQSPYVQAQYEQKREINEKIQNILDKHMKINQQTIQKSEEKKENDKNEEEAKMNDDENRKPPASLSPARQLETKTQISPMKQHSFSPLLNRSNNNKMYFYNSQKKNKPIDNLQNSKFIIQKV